jgi:hypothetical protein
MITERFDLTSESADVAEAIVASWERLERLKREIAEEARNYERLNGTFVALLGPLAYGRPVPELIANAEANMKRSVKAVVKRRKREGRTAEEAKDAAIRNAEMVGYKHGLNRPTQAVRDYVDIVLAEVYGLNRPKKLNLIRQKIVSNPGVRPSNAE